MKIKSKLFTLAAFTIFTFGRGQLELEKIEDTMVYQTPPFEQCHASTLVEITKDVFLAAAFGGTREGNKDVSIWLSRFEQGQWGAPVKIATGQAADGMRYPNWNPVLYRVDAKSIYLFYKTGPSPRAWWGMYKMSHDEGRSWGDSHRLPEGILGPIKNKPITLDNGTLLSPSSTETRTAEGLSWKIHIEKSIDQGKNWEKIPVDPNTPYDVIQPSILVHSQQKLQLLCRSRNDMLMQAFSYDGGNTWSKITKTQLPNPNSGTDAVTLKNGKHLLVYNPTTNGKNDRAKLNIAYSADGTNWEDLLILENENKGEFSYPALIQASDGNIHLTYTHNRKNIKYLVFKVK
ncbi:exo-alpha-sialidase [Flavobacteriaceae bacterium]|jgi:predicted neuraminidase|nr:exo-alpha-sialidase [Flavobacteriaceae bacterium]MDA8900364.1 exo-alpha-sialidase [Flavobacteriaceae bacterium]MDA8993050.1 exo-alpha-sialidase [Flavobacteriaceae bacterium]